MAGILLVSGQVWALNQMRTKILSLGGLYVGLMTNAIVPAETAQVCSGITELIDPSCSGYYRHLSIDWIVNSGVDPCISGDPVTFTTSGDWENVNGYFVSDSNTTGVANALWTETFPIEKQGLWLSGEQMIITPIYEQMYYGEI
jgi:hypothetical protein